MIARHSRARQQPRLRAEVSTVARRGPGLCVHRGSHAPIGEDRAPDALYVASGAPSLSRRGRGMPGKRPGCDRRCLNATRGGPFSAPAAMHVSHDLLADMGGSLSRVLPHSVARLAEPSKASATRRRAPQCIVSEPLAGNWRPPIEALTAARTALSRGSGVGSASAVPPAPASSFPRRLHTRSTDRRFLCS